MNFRIQLQNYNLRFLSLRGDVSPKPPSSKVQAHDRWRRYLFRMLGWVPHVSDCGNCDMNSNFFANLESSNRIAGIEVFPKRKLSLKIGLKRALAYSWWYRYRCFLNFKHLEIKTIFITYGVVVPIAIMVDVEYPTSSAFNLYTQSANLPGN